MIIILKERGHPMYIDSNCTGCGLCIDECSFTAISLENGKAVIDDSLCRACGICSEACPVGAIKWDNAITPVAAKQENYSPRESIPPAPKPAQNKIQKILNSIDSLFKKDGIIENSRAMGRGIGKGSGSGKNSGRGCGGGKGSGTCKGKGRGRSL